MLLDPLFVEIIEHTIDLIKSRHHVTDFAAQRLLIIALDTVDRQLSQAIDDAVNLLAIWAKCIDANKRLQPTSESADENPC